MEVVEVFEVTNFVCTCMASQRWSSDKGFETADGFPRAGRLDISIEDALGNGLKCVIDG
jgi:hypothetical protein